MTKRCKRHSWERAADRLLEPYTAGDGRTRQCIVNQCAKCGRHGYFDCETNRRVRR